MISVVYILVGDSFYSNKIYFNLESALEKLKNTSPYRYILGYIPDRRDVNSEGKVVIKYDMRFDALNGYRVNEEKLWNYEDTDHGFLYNINKNLIEIFEYDKFDNIIKLKDILDDNKDKLLASYYPIFPYWLKKIIESL
jgi:hypothetical protein